MPLPDISLAQFNRIATGDYNAGQIDFKTKDDGTAELVKINNHVWRKSLNNVELSPERILEVKEAFLNALQKGGVSDAAMREIRDRLGLSPELDVSADATQRLGIIKARFSPLTRAQVRSILDEYSGLAQRFEGGRQNREHERQSIQDARPRERRIAEHLRQARDVGREIHDD